MSTYCLVLLCSPRFDTAERMNLHITRVLFALFLARDVLDQS